MEIDKEEVVAEILIEIENGASEREALRKVSEKYRIIDQRIRGTLHSIVFEILRRLNIIDFIINESLQKGKIEKLYPMLRNLLRFGVYNLKFTEHPPQKTTKLIVEKVKELFKESLSKFSNALLRKIEKLELKDIITDSLDPKNLRFKYYYPQWFIEYLIKLVGLSDTIKFLERGLGIDATYIRVNTLITDTFSVLRELKEEGFIAQVDQDLSDVIKIDLGKYPIVRSPSLKKGCFYIQDKASALVSHCVDPQKNDIIYDLCAAPGGKAMHVGQLLQNTGIILAADRSHRRLLELSSKLVEYNLQNIYVLNIPGENLHEFIPLKADKVIIDPPCSGTGTFISRPYSKWKFNFKDLGLLTKIQWKLLKAAVKSIGESGEIIYSTCSILVEENERIIMKFLKKFPEFSLVPVQPFIGTPGFLGLSETQRLWPHLHDTQGFFISKLKKN